MPTSNLLKELAQKLWETEYLKKFYSVTANVGRKFYDLAN